MNLNLRWRSGQSQQTVNLSSLSLRGFESLPQDSEKKTGFIPAFFMQYLGIRTAGVDACDRTRRGREFSTLGEKLVTRIPPSGLKTLQKALQFAFQALVNLLEPYPIQAVNLQQNIHGLRYFSFR